MRSRWAQACLCALTLGLLALPARAAEESVFQECCHRCRRQVACYPPPCGYSVTTCYEARRCGPIRRLLGICCRPVVVRVQPACPPPPCVPACAPPTLVPAAPPAFAPAPAVTPVPAVPTPLPPSAPAPSPISSSSYPTRGPTALPPAAPIRLDRIAARPSDGPVEAQPAVLTRQPPAR